MPPPPPSPAMHWKGGRYPPALRAPSLCPATALAPSASLNVCCWEWGVGEWGGGGGAGMHGKGGGVTPPLQSAQPVPSHCPPGGRQASLSQKETKRGLLVGVGAGKGSDRLPLRTETCGGGGGVGMTTGGVSWSAVGGAQCPDRDSLPFPQPLSLGRRWCPSASHRLAPPPLPSLGLSFPLYSPLPRPHGRLC